MRFVSPFQKFPTREEIINGATKPCRSTVQFRLPYYRSSYSAGPCLQLQWCGRACN